MTEIPPALRAVLRSVGWDDAPTESVNVIQDADTLPTRYPIEDIAAGTLAAVGLAVSALWERRTGRRQRVALDRSAAGLAMASADFLRVDDGGQRTWDPFTGFYRAGDGRWVYLHGNFAHLRDGLLDLLGVENDRDAVSAAVAGRESWVLEDAAIARNLCAAVVRLREEWTAHPQQRAIAALPLIEIDRIGDAPPEALPEAARPLGGLRMLDCSRVIAGPTVGRTFAEHGATVLRVNGPHLPYLEPLVIDTGIGKRSCHLDLREPAAMRTFEGLLADADVFLDGYRPGALAARGLTPERLMDIRPGIVAVSLSAWSRAGPWAGRRGYDSLVQAACGLALDGPDAKPERQPCAVLDYLAGYLGAFGAMVALRKRAAEGGSWRVTVSLARCAEWIFEMTREIGFKPSPPAAALAPADIPERLQQRDSSFGRLSHLAPVLRLSETPPGWDRPPVPPGADPPAWP